MRELDPRRLARWYVVLVGALLLAEGSALLVIDRLDLNAVIATNDSRHNLLHVVWGIALLALVLAHREVFGALLFGAFYVALGVLGLVLSNPLGLLLGPGENAFHFVVGPLALLFGLWAYRSNSASSAWTFRPTSAGGGG